MASTTWVGGASGSETDWATGANWSTGSIPTTSAHVVIPNTTHSCALDTTRTIGSLTIQAGGTIIGGGNKLFIQSEGDASGGTEHFALKNDGIISGNLDIDFTFAGETAADFTGSSGNFQNVKVNASGADVNQIGAATFDGTLTIVANATYDAGNDGLTVTGDVSCSGTFLGNSTTTISHGSLTIASGGTYSATSGTTTITGEASSNYAIEVSGTFTHNSGTLKITTDNNTFVKILDDVNHLIIEAATATRVYEWVSNTTIQGDLTINAGRFAHYSPLFSLDVNGDCTINNTGTLTGGSGSIELGSLTIESGGTYTATSGTTTITTGDFSHKTGGTFTHNDGEVVIASAGGDVGGSSTGTIFHKLETTSYVDLVKSITVENRLKAGGSSSFRFPNNITITMGTASVAGEIQTGSSADKGLRFNTASKTIKFAATSQSKPWFATDSGAGWNIQAASVKVQLENGDFQYTFETDPNDRGFGGEYELTGDMEFDAVTVNTGDTLDLNGQRAKLSGTLTGAGTVACGTNALIETAGLINFDNTGTWSGNCNIISTASANHYLKPSTVAAHNITNLFLKDGANPQRWQNNFIQSIIVGGGTQSFGDPPPTTGPIENITIATGATVNAADRTLTFDGDFTTSGGLIGKSAMTFDGTNDEVDFAHPASTDLTGAFTIEGWFKPDATSLQAVVGKVNFGSAGTKEYGISINGSRWFFKCCSASASDDISSDVTITTGKWYHVAVTKDSSGVMKMYVDGRLQSGTVTVAGDCNGAHAFRMGRRTNNTDFYYDGDIARTSIWSAELTEAQIRTLMFQDYDAVSTTNLNAWWQFDKGSGSTVFDSTSNNVDGTISGASWVGAGTFTKGTSTLVFNKSGAQTLNFYSSDNFENITINAGSTVSLNGFGLGSGNPLDCFGNLVVNGTLTDSGKSSIMKLRTADKTHDFSGTLTGLYQIIVDISSGSLNIPALNTPRLRFSTSVTGTATGNLTLTEELQVDTNTTFVANGKTITAKLVDLNDGTFNLGEGTLILSHTGGSNGFDTNAASVLAAGPGATISGSSAGTTFKSRNNFVVVGKVENLDVTNEELSVTGQVINCTGDVIQQFPTIDHDQQLDFDTAEDRDIILGRDLDKNTELINS